MNGSPNPSSFAQSGDRSRFDGTNISPIPGGMSWLLDSGTANKNKSPGAQFPSPPSSASLLSNSSHGNYYSMHHVSSNERMTRRKSSTSSLRVNSSIPELSQLQQAPQIEVKEEPVDVLSQSIQACTSNIFGLYGLEIWKLDKDSGSLINLPIKSPNVLDIRRQSSGIFIKRVTQEADHLSANYNSAARDAFERLTDTTRLDHLSQRTTDPGVGVAGALWSEATMSKPLAAVQNGVQSLSDTIHRRVRRLTTHGIENDHTNDVLWREIDTLAEDPDQPYDERLQSFAQAGFRLAAGIPFDIRGFSGIVVFFANPHADGKKLRDSTNSQLIQFAAQFIGSAAAIQNPIQNATLQRHRRPASNWRTLRVKILAVIKFQRPLHVRRRGRSRSWGSPTLRRVDSFKLGLRRAASLAMNREESFKLLSEATTRLKKDIQKGVENVQYVSKAKTMKWWQKVQGGHASIPPSFNTVQCLWTFMGVFSTHTILSWLDFFIITTSGGKYQLLLGPLGALTTLQYNLTAAPASQPRNAFFSQVFALTTCYLLHQIQDLDKWHRCALAPAIVTTTTARLGIIHPPAGATSIVFSYEKYGPEDMAIFLVGVSIAIFTAVVINNLSDKRQYPSTKWTICHYFYSPQDNKLGPSLLPC